MTLPDERYRAVIWAKQFLLELATDKQKYPRVPKTVRQQAHSILRHYPGEWDMQQVAEASPHVFAERLEPVTRLFKQYELSKADKNEN